MAMKGYSTAHKSAVSGLRGSSILSSPALSCPNFWPISGFREISAKKLPEFADYSGSVE
jgi:hypothetical protein